jgi:hypothetical protein
VPSIRDQTRHFLQRENRRLSTLKRQTKAAFAQLARTARLVLRAHEPSRREFLVVPGSTSDIGFFAEFATILGLLEHFDKWRNHYSGIRIDFGTRGLYYDPAFGSNWWEYYFEPVRIGAGPSASETVIGDDEKFRCAKRVERTMPRTLGFRLIDRYIHAKPHICERVDSYVRAKFDGAFVIGVHYRGTDKFEDAPRVPYERVRSAVSDLVKSTGAAQFRLFVATDEQAFLEYMLAAFPGRLLHLEMVRSSDGRPIDLIQGENRKKGENALLDCLLLSKCDFLVRTASNLSLCSTLFNPNMPVALLNRER